MVYREVIRPLVRTGVLSAVGAVGAWFASHGVTLDGDAKTALVVGFMGLIGSTYYLLVRLAERRWPAVGRLLGARADDRPPAQ